MIYLEKNTANTVILELSILDPANLYFLFGFVWETGTSPDTRYLIETNTSTALDRYDEFVFTESDTGSIAAITDTLPIFLNPGQYDYTVWGSPTAITPANAIAVAGGTPISSGRMVVAGDSLTVPPVYDSTFPDPNPIPNVYA